MGYRYLCSNTLLILFQIIIAYSFSLSTLGANLLSLLVMLSFRSCSVALFTLVCFRIVECLLLYLTLRSKLAPAASSMFILYPNQGTLFSVDIYFLSSFIPILEEIRSEWTYWGHCYSAECETCCRSDHNHL